MTPLFSVETTAAFMRWFSKLARKHAELPGLLADAEAILAADPYNRTCAHNIKKLTAIPRGEGQYRLRIGRWRFRYDIYNQVVLLVDCSLRREDTYR